MSSIFVLCTIVYQGDNIYFSWFRLFSKLKFTKRLSDCAAPIVG